MASILSLEVVLGAALGGAFGRVFSNATSKVGQLGDAVKATRGQLRNIKAYEDTQAALGQTQAKMDAARAKVGELQAAMANGGGSKKMATQLDKAEKQTAKLSTTLGAQKTQLATDGAALRKTGVDTNKLGAATAALNARLTEQQGALDRTTQRLNRRRGAMNDMRSQIGKLAGTVLFGKKAIGSAISFETAMADVKKVVDFDTPQQFGEMEKAINDMALRLPMAREGLAGIIAAGAQAGLPRKELVGFAEDAAKMGIAFDTTAEDAGQKMAQWRKAFDLSQDGVRALGDQVNLLGNTAGASALDITEILSAVGPLGKVGGLAGGQIAALGATMRSMGIDTATAGTGVKNLMLTMTAGTSATPKQAAALQTLGIDATKLAERMQKDAGGAIVALMTRLKALPKAVQAATLTQLLGRESVGAVAPLLSNLDALKDNLRKVGDASKYSGSMELEFLARAQSTDMALELGKSAWSELTGTIGKVFLPTIKVVVGLFIRVTKGVMRFADAFPRLTSGLVIATTAFLTFKTAVAGATFLSTFLPGLTKMAPLLNLAAKGVTFLATAFRVLTVAMLTNPIGLAITALTVGALLIYKNWDFISMKLGDAADSVKNAWTSTSDTISMALGDAADSVKNAWTSTSDTTSMALGDAADSVGNAWSATTSAIGGAWDATQQKLAAGGGWLSGAMQQAGSAIAGAWDDPIGSLGRAWDGLKAKVGKIIDWMSEKFAWFRKGMDGLKSVADKVGNVGGKLGDAFHDGWDKLRGGASKAAGTAVLGAALAAPVGATGVPPRNLPTLPAAATATRGAPAVDQSTHTTTVTVQGTPGMDERRLAQEVRRQLDDRDRAQAARTRSTLGDLE